MKIYPVNISNFTPKVHRQNHNNEKVFAGYETNYELPNTYMPVVSFGGNLDEFKKQMLALDDIHCPGCGNKMLSENKIKQIVHQSATLTTIPAYAKFLEKNKDYIHPEFQPLLWYVNRFAQNTPEKSLPDMFRIISKGASTVIKKQFDRETVYLEKLLKEEKFSDEDRNKISECIEYLKSLENIPKYNDFKKEMLSTFGNLEHEKKWEIYGKIKKDLQKVYSYNYVLRHRDNKTAGLPEHAAVLYNVLSHSANNLAGIYNKSGYDKRFNNFLLCKSCSDSYKSFSGIISGDESQQKLKTYVDDIADAIAERKLENNNLYLYEFLGGVKGITRGRISLDRHKIRSEAKNSIFREGKSLYMFDSYSDIPCACCGTLMLTHEEKQNIYNQIINSDGLYELRNIAKINAKHIRPKYEIILERFNKILEKYPDISDKDMMIKLQNLSKRYLKQQIEKNKQAVLKYQAKNKLNYLDNEFINDYVREINRKYKKFSLENEFRYDDYERLIHFTLKKLSVKDRDKVVNLAMDNMKNLYLQNRLVNPLPHVVEKAGGQAKVMFENIFRGSVITVDHICSRDSGGADEYYNKIGYCRDCNHEKSNMMFKDWLKLHPEISKNLPKHLAKISDIIKKDNLYTMSDYPEKVARLSMNLAGGKLKIPVKYDTKD